MEETIVYVPYGYHPIVEVTRPRTVHHGLHAVLTLLTGGLWAPIWIALAATA